MSLSVLKPGRKWCVGRLGGKGKGLPGKDWEKGEGQDRGKDWGRPMGKGYGESTRDRTRERTRHRHSPSLSQ